MQTNGITMGEIKAFATKDLQENLEAIVNAKSHRREPYYMLVIFGEGYHGPAAKGTNNYLLHGEDKKQAPMTGATKDIDLSGLKVMKQTIQVLEPCMVPNIPLIGTTLIKVDNKRGSVDFVYILPPDKPIVSGFEVEGHSETAEKCGANMPYIYGGD